MNNNTTCSILARSLASSIITVKYGADCIWLAISRTTCRDMIECNSFWISREVYFICIFSLKTLMSWKSSALKSNNDRSWNPNHYEAYHLSKGRPWCPKKRIDQMIFSIYSQLLFFSVAAAFDNMSATSLVAFSASLAALWKLLLWCSTKIQVASFQLVKPFTRKLDSDNLVSPIFFPFTSLQQRKQKAESSRIIKNPWETMKQRCLKKTLFSGWALPKEWGGKE